MFYNSIKEFRCGERSMFMSDEEKRKFEIIKGILEDLKEITKPQNWDKPVKET